MSLLSYIKSLETRDYMGEASLVKTLNATNLGSTRKVASACKSWL